MDITFKFILDTRRQKKNCTYPLKLRVYYSGTYKDLNLRTDLPSTDWDEPLQRVGKTNRNHKVLNAKLESIKARVLKTLLLSEVKGVELNASELIHAIVNNSEKPQTDIISYGRQHIQTLHSSGQIGTAIAYSCAIQKLLAYCKKDKLPFEELNYSYLNDFSKALLQDGLKVNSISVYMRSLRALFNKAIRAGVIPFSCYPFSSFKIANERTFNRILTIEELKLLHRHNTLPYTLEEEAKNLFFLSFYLVGINFSDLLTLKNEALQDGRIVFRRCKTHKIYSIQVHSEATKILNYYRMKSSVSGDYILPFLKNINNPLDLKKSILQRIKVTNFYLKRIASKNHIQKPVTTYYARYSWANVAKMIGYSKDRISEALGHEYGNKVTGGYLDNYPLEYIDEMNNKVVETICAG